MRDDFIDDDEILDDDDDSRSLIDPPAKASKAWRSIERLHEMKELRRHLEDDLLFGDVYDDTNDLYL